MFKEIPCLPKTPLCDICYMQAVWENLVWEKFKLEITGNAGSFDIIGHERLSAKIEFLEEEITRLQAGAP
jgi:uncharacterized small protein (DUF1192 family)